MSLSNADSIRKEEEQKAKRTETLFSLLPDAFHMTETELAGRDGTILREMFELMFP